MKKCRIWVCLILIACLLLLSACGKIENHSKSGSAQAAGQTDAVQMPSSENAQEEDGKLIWSSKVFDTFVGPKNTYSQERVCTRLTYDTWQETVTLRQQDHHNCEQLGHCSYNPYIQCNVIEYLSTTSYNEEYFSENTLLAINLQVDAHNTATLSDVQYADGVLTCFVELGKPIRRMLSSRRTLYVQIETVLPEDTEFKLEITAKPQTESELALQEKVSFKRLRGWDLWKKDEPQIAKVLDWETYQAFATECANHGVTCPTYPKEFFDDRSLVVVGLASGSGSTIYELYDLHYAQGVLTCFVDIPTFPEGQNTDDMASWLCFIEVDTVLPADTEVILDSGGVEYDYDTFMQKVAQFQEQLIK